jgi:hypothetical protein
MPEPKSSDFTPTSQLPQAQAARRVQQLAEEKLQARRKERQLRNHMQKVGLLAYFINLMFLDSRVKESAL